MELCPANYLHDCSICHSVVSNLAAGLCGSHIGPMYPCTRTPSQVAFFLRIFNTIAIPTSRPLSNTTQTPRIHTLSPVSHFLPVSHLSPVSHFLPVSRHSKLLPVRTATIKQCGRYVPAHTSMHSFDTCTLHNNSISGSMPDNLVNFTKYTIH